MTLPPLPITRDHPCHGVHYGPIFIQGDVQTCGHCARVVPDAEATLSRKVAGTSGEIMLRALHVSKIVCEDLGC